VKETYSSIEKIT